MIPAHAIMPLESLERLLCRELGCRPVTEERADPVARFPVCLRCGRWWR